MPIAENKYLDKNAFCYQESDTGLKNYSYVDSESAFVDRGISLDTLGVKHNCDKSSVNRSVEGAAVKSAGHDYLRKYEFFIDRFRQKPDFNLLELGIGPDWNMGASLKIWLDYFCREDFRATIADINPSARNFEGARVHIKVGNLGDTEFLDSLGLEQYDLIVDDASHIWSHQIDAFERLFASVSEGGVYIIEDLQTSFGKARKKWGINCTQDAFDYFNKLSGRIVGGSAYHPLSGDSEKHLRMSELSKSIESITFIRHSCVICKSGFY